MAGALAAGRLVAPAIADPRAPLTIWLRWRARGGGRALRWFVDRLSAAGR